MNDGERRPYCRECWCEHSAIDCTHYAVEQVGGRWLCASHAALAKGLR